jgi:hypothetical protein
VANIKRLAIFKFHNKLLKIGFTKILGSKLMQTNALIHCTKDTALLSKQQRDLTLGGVPLERNDIILKRSDIDPAPQSRATKCN